MTTTVSLAALVQMRSPKESMELQQLAVLIPEPTAVCSCCGRLVTEEASGSHPCFFEE